MQGAAEFPQGPRACQHARCTEKLWGTRGQNKNLQGSYVGHIEIMEKKMETIGITGVIYI